MSLAALLASAAGCRQEFEKPEEPKGPGDVYLSANVSIRGVGDINTSADFEDRVKTVRLLIFDSGSGTVLYNRVHPVGDFTGQPVGASQVWSKPFKITEGNRDFFFVANEQDWGLDVALASVTTRAQLFALPALTKIEFPAGYRPSEAKPMLMTRVYRNVPVTALRNGKGSSAADPQHFVADGDEEVELIRTLAKVKLKLEGVVNVDEVGGTYQPTAIKFKRVVPFKGISLVDVPKYFSLFVNPYFNGAGYPSNGDFSADFYNAADLQETVSFTEAQMLANSEAHYLAPTVQPGLASTYYDYVTSFYVPENLRRLNAGDPATPGYVNGATSFFVTDAGNVDYYKFSIWQTSFTENQQEVATGVHYVLPNAANYSKFSTVRNNVYDITAKEGFQLTLHYDIEDWCTGKIGRVYAGYNFNVVVDEPTFPGGESTVHIITAEKNLVQLGLVELEPLIGGAQFTVGTDTRNTLRFGNQPGQSGFQERVDATLRFPSQPAAGTPLFRIKHNNKVVYTVKCE